MNATIRVLASPGLSVARDNPYTSLLYSHIRCGVVDDFTCKAAFRAKYDIVHFHWPEAALNYSRNRLSAKLRLARQFAAIDVLRARGARLFWTVHNLRSHERSFPALERGFWNSFIRRLDAYIALSRFGQEAAMETFPRLRTIPGFVIPHGHYRDSYPSVMSDSRRLLNLSRESEVILHLGFIRPYKNVPALIRAFKANRNPNAVLMIAGRTSTDEVRSEIKQVASDDTRIRLDLNHIPEQQVARYFAAADLVVLPYTDILNSGSALLALSFNRPVLLPNAGAIPELVEDVGGDWVRCYESQLTSNDLAVSLKWARTHPRSQRAPVDHLGWPTIAAQTRRAYEAILAKDPRA